MNGDRMIRGVTYPCRQHRSPESKRAQRRGDGNVDFRLARALRTLAGQCAVGLVTVRQKSHAFGRAPDGKTQRYADQQEQNTSDGRSPTPAPGLDDDA